MLVRFSPTRVTASPKSNNRENGTVNLVKNLRQVDADGAGDI